jgi:pimeloyl-ACP methyl ester carboxylesterase
MDHDRRIIPGAQMITIEDDGHFLPLDQPDAMIERLRALNVTPSSAVGYRSA